MLETIPAGLTELSLFSEWLCNESSFPRSPDRSQYTLLLLGSLKDMSLRNVLAGTTPVSFIHFYHWFTRAIIHVNLSTFSLVCEHVYVSARGKNIGTCICIGVIVSRGNSELVSF